MPCSRTRWLGASWEGFAIENLIAAAPEGTSAYYCRTSGGAETVLLLELPRGERWAVEIKRSTAPAATRGFHQARADVRPRRSFVVYQGAERFPLAERVEAVPLPELARELTALRKKS
ncbi:MAG: DUF4143 domain-containing protein [Candidatus Binatia bacterium]|nr:DUF4143 domain-containing protein [Candidatus Binatia bacterium]